MKSLLSSKNARRVVYWLTKPARRQTGLNTRSLLLEPIRPSPNDVPIGRWIHVSFEKISMGKYVSIFIWGLTSVTGSAATTVFCEGAISAGLQALLHNAALSDFQCWRRSRILVEHWRFSSPIFYMRKWMNCRYMRWTVCEGAFPGRHSWKFDSPSLFPYSLLCFSPTENKG